jgi:small conductance mechanosensitive channel
VDGLDDSQVTIKLRIKTVPLKQWEIGRELRRRIKNAFDARGVEIPFRQLSVHLDNALLENLGLQKAGQRRSQA